MKLLHVLIEGQFKSIISCDVFVPPNFVLVVGKNGAGKSNFFDAISFGLGSPINALRVSNCGEIVGENQFVKVSLSFGLKSDEVLLVF